MRKVVLLTLIMACGCAKREAPDDARVHTLRLPADEPDPPAGPEKNAFMASCLVCHSSRYVTNQPALARAKWQAEVEKMQKAYGAPVPPENVPKIVDYLVAIQDGGS
jgi:hypothetical protein